MEISFASFATIADVVLPVKTGKNSFRPSKKNQPGRSLHNLMAFSGATDATTLKLKAAISVFSIDINKESPGGETRKFNDNLLVFDGESLAIIALVWLLSSIFRVLTHVKIKKY